ncbi:unnamed protein product [Rotaria socialis]|uniref:IC97/Casc1 N-terminal domain-containing protein n=2 Tax=Rotaria socialis TaxID=392032 RepID=A0A819YZY9_9BILA|nr:unnamed protein product [Rotaria socialis]CAF4317637.1 unnamed protein product [Rotaria socialis]CAF4584344.1 unnamed protein product [Rotaria socialis]
MLRSKITSRIKNQPLKIPTSINPSDVTSTNRIVSKKTKLNKTYSTKTLKGKEKTNKSATPSNKSAKTKKKKEDEERKRKEEGNDHLVLFLDEEAQQRAEVAEKERLENEKRLAEEKTNVAKEINELRRRELSEFYEFILPRQQDVITILERQREDFKWKRVMQCDGTPDPTILPEINTFISLWRDEKKRIDVEYTMKQTNLVLSLIRELNYVMNSIPNGSPELEHVSTYKKTIEELEDTLHLKWRHAVHATMLKASDLQDLETNNLQYTAENDNTTVCIWGNLSHNPRIKGYQFDKYSFGFDLPKPLSLANIAIIGFFLKYDYYSERSLLAKCRVKINQYSYDPIPEPYIDESEKKPAESNDPEKDLFDASLPPELRKLMEETKQREDEAAAAAAAAEAEANRENTMTDRSATQVVSDEAHDGKNLTQTSLERQKSKDEKLLNATADQILEELADESVVDLRSHWPILPLLQINLYNIPPQPKKVQEWTIVEVDNDDILISYPYPSDPMIAERFYEEYSSGNKQKSMENEPGKSKTEEKVLKKNKTATEETMDPSMTLDATMIENNPEIRKMFLDAAVKQESALVLKYKIPNDVFVTEKPLLARWITDRNHWRQEGYVEYQYSPDTRLISFKTYDFGTYALLSDRHAHMPFQSWRMRPKSVNNLLFILNSQSFEIIFEVKVSSAAFYLCK